MVLCLFIVRVYLTLVKAVTLILKHATFLRASLPEKSALTTAELNYRKANIDATIQKHLEACASEQSVEQFVGFIMNTDMGLFLFIFSICNINILLFFQSHLSAQLVTAGLIVGALSYADYHWDCLVSCHVPSCLTHVLVLQQPEPLGFCDSCTHSITVQCFLIFFSVQLLVVVIVGLHFILCHWS